MGVGGSSSSSKPVDMTPAAFKNLQGPFASVFASLLGFGPPGAGQSGNGTGWTQDGKGGWVYNPTGGAVTTTTTGNQFGGTGGSRKRMGGSQNGGSVWRNNQYAATPSGQGGGQTTTTTIAPGTGTGQPTDPNQILAGIPKYQGPLTAGIGANEQSILDMLMGNATGQGGGTTTAGPNSNALSYLDKVLAGDFMPGGATPGGLQNFAQMLQGAQQTQGYQGTMEEMNPFLQASIQAAQRPTLQGLEETLSRTLPGRFTEAGQFKQPGGSSAFDRAAAIASRGASDSLADIATNLSYATYEAERGRTFEAQEAARQREDTALQGELDRIFQGQQGERDRQNEAAGLTSTIKTQEVDNLVKNLQAQALPRLIQEFGIERGMEQFNNQVNSLLAVLGIAQGVTAPVIGQKEKSSSAQLSLK